MLRGKWRDFTPTPTGADHAYQGSRAVTNGLRYSCSRALEDVFFWDLFYCFWLHCTYLLSTAHACKQAGYLLFIFGTRNFSLQSMLLRKRFEQEVVLFINLSTLILDRHLTCILFPCFYAPSKRQLIIHPFLFMFLSVIRVEKYMHKMCAYNRSKMGSITNLTYL